ncbi:MAG: ABC transporter substrate-binding protein [Spirochaetales bacterium]|nr:ABC transporter substrate-binding protein [Spirochaetales bacterium]
MKKMVLIGFSVSIAVLPIFAGGQGEPQEAESVITAAYESEPGNLNTIIWPTTSDTNVTHLVYDSLVIPDENLEMVGRLAEDWTVSDDGTVYTFNLRRGVTWHDGTPFTAGDVEFTFTAMAHPDYDMGSTGRALTILGASEFRSGAADSVEGIEVIDEYTIRFTLVEAYAPFLSDLFIGILPAHVWSDVNPTDWAQHPANREPVGTGPYRFVQWEAGQYIELAANADYFGGAPANDRLILRFGDQNTLLASFVSGAIDIVPAPAAEIETIESLDSAQLALADQLTFFYIGFNVRNEHFSNPNIRIAMAHATDKEQIVSTILGELGAVQHDIFPQGHWSHNPETAQFPYDPARARRMIEAEGYVEGPDGFYVRDGVELGLTLEVPTGKREREQTAVLLKQYWEEVGIRTELRYQDFPTLVTKLLPRTQDGRQREVTAEDFDAYILGFGVEADPNEYRTYFHSTTMPPDGYNFCGYADPEVDRLFDAQLTATDFDERRELFWEISRNLIEEQVWLPLYYQKLSFAYNEGVGGFAPDYRGFTFNAAEWTK